MTAEYGDIVYEERAGAAIVCINRPDSLNALRVGTYEELADVLLRAGWNKSVGVVVLTGTGKRAFCVGADTSQGRADFGARAPLPGQRRARRLAGAGYPDAAFGDTAASHAAKPTARPRYQRCSRGFENPIGINSRSGRDIEACSEAGLLLINTMNEDHHELRKHPDRA